jgi:hypothetical protein
MERTYERLFIALLVLLAVARIVGGVAFPTWFLVTLAVLVAVQWTVIVFRMVDRG